MFPEIKSRETLRFSGNKIHCSPRDQSLSVKYSQIRVSPSFEPRVIIRVTECDRDKVLP